MWNLKKNDTNELIYRIETDAQTSKKNLWLPKGKGEAGINQGFGINIYTRPYIKQINNKYLLQSTGNYTQSCNDDYNREESEKEYIHIHIYI